MLLLTYLLYVLAACACPQVAALSIRPNFCKFIKVRVDSQRPMDFGWYLLDAETGKALNGAHYSPGAYKKSSAGRTYCYAVRLPLGSQKHKLQLLGAKGATWADGYVASADSANCSRIVKVPSGKRELFRKTKGGAHTITPILTGPRRLCGILHREPWRPRPRKLPDMIPVASMTANSLTGASTVEWNLSRRPTTLQGNISYCEAQEAGGKTGNWTVLRFTVAIGNFGSAPLIVGDPLQQLSSGLFEYATCHAHYHWKSFASYELVHVATNKTWRSAKRGFCMNDWQRIPAAELSKVVDKTVIPPVKQFTRCGNNATRGQGMQGVSVGYMDVYNKDITGQFFVLDGGDGQPVVAPGKYVIRITANPPFKAGKGMPCRVLDTKGRCRAFSELNYDNNVIEVPFTYAPTG